MSDCPESAQRQHKRVCICSHRNETNLFDIYHHRRRRCRSRLCHPNKRTKNIVPYVLVNTRFASPHTNPHICNGIFVCVCVPKCLCLGAARASELICTSFIDLAIVLNYIVLAQYQTKRIRNVCVCVCAERKANAKFNHKENGNGIHLWQLGEGGRCVGRVMVTATCENGSSSKIKKREKNKMKTSKCGCW